MEVSRLHIAVERLDVDAVRALLESDPSQVHSHPPERNGARPLHRLCCGRQTGAAETIAALLLEHGADAAIGDAAANTPLHYLSLHSRSLADDSTVAEKLLAHGADVNAVNNRGFSCLRVVVWRSSSSGQRPPPSLAVRLIKHGAALDPRWADELCDEHEGTG